jgi:hypothetical protein
MFLPFLLSALLWLPIAGATTQGPQLPSLFQQHPALKLSEFQALNIMMDFGSTPEPQRLSRREKIALKLTQITKTITN